MVFIPCETAEWDSQPLVLPVSNWYGVPFAVFVLPTSDSVTCSDSFSTICQGEMWTAGINPLPYLFRSFQTTAAECKIPFTLAAIPPFHRFSTTCLEAIFPPASHLAAVLSNVLWSGKLSKLNEWTLCMFSVPVLPSNDLNGVCEENFLNVNGPVITHQLWPSIDRRCPSPLPVCIMTFQSLHLSPKATLLSSFLRCWVNASTAPEIRFLFLDWIDNFPDNFINFKKKKRNIPI